MNQTGDVLMAVRRTIKLYEQCLAPVRRQYKLSGLEINVLSFLHNNPGLNTVAEISELRMLSKGNVSQAADSLLQRGYLRREPDKKDRRLVHFLLEADAQPIITDILAAADLFEQKLFVNFSPAQREEYRMLNKMCFTNVQNSLEEG